MLPVDPISQYVKVLGVHLGKGITTEHSHRDTLKRLLLDLNPKTQSIEVVNEPKRIECGAPDLVVLRTERKVNLTIGYVETKDVGKSLDESEKSEQLRRYLRSLPNLVLTNYIEFRHYVEGKRYADATLGALGFDSKVRLKGDKDDKVRLLLEDFLKRTPKPVESPKELAERMARITHMIRDVVTEALLSGKSKMLKELREVVASTLARELGTKEKIPEFADMFAQTLAYGLFAARVNHHGGIGTFTRQLASRDIPKTNPFLRKLFDRIAGPDIDDEPYVGLVDDLTSLLSYTEMSRVLEDFGSETKQTDPVVHFYETFLKAYDPTLRELRGVYFTPEPVVSYIVRSVDLLLKEHFDCPDGLADTQSVEVEKTELVSDKERNVIEKKPKVLILDPACGTGTFLYSVIDFIRDKFREKNDAGGWQGYVPNQLLPRLYGFELLMAPYAVAHLKLAMQLAGMDIKEIFRKPWVYDLNAGERLNVFYTNTLEDPDRSILHLPGFREVTEESLKAQFVKKKLPILVIMGNPPYSGQSANKGEWISNLLKGKLRVKNGDPNSLGDSVPSYFDCDGQPLGERNPKWLNDDYVKFIRWSQWRIEQEGAGILAFITNHRYLSNPTFRGMREKLIRSFDDIYILDLHGNYKEREVTPDGSKDENVFDIQQGVAISIFVKKRGGKGNAVVKHADLWGKRERKSGHSKYSWLRKNNVRTTHWTKLKPKSPDYWLIPFDARKQIEYEQHKRINAIMPINSVAIVTGQDEQAIAFQESEVRDLAASHGLDTAFVKPISYRAFDKRFIVYHPSIVTRDRAEIAQHILEGSNIALVTCRQQSRRDISWSLAMAARGLVESCYISNFTREINSLFPLYLYDREYGDPVKRPNLDVDMVKDVSKKLKLSFIPDGRGNLKTTFGPEDVFNYIYAMFFSPMYRTRYVEFLRMDFPRVPFTSNTKLFKEMCKLGRKLVSFHLLEAEELQSEFDLVTVYPVKGENDVEKGFPRYYPPGSSPPEALDKLRLGRVYISKGSAREGRDAQYFDGVPPEVWDFHIGGYQVCEKWLKDRRGKTLSGEDIIHYKRIVEALGRTIELMRDIDATIDKNGGWPIE
jgi:hypothetical protein